MAQLDPTQQAALTQQLAALKARDPQGWAAAVVPEAHIVHPMYLHNNGIDIPPNSVVVNADGSVKPSQSLGNFLGKAALGVGAALTGGLALGALGAGGAAASGATAAGSAGTAAGTTAATTGGILGTAKALAGRLSGLAYGRQQGREAEAAAQQQQDRNAIGAAQVNLGAGQQRASQSVRGDILANAQDLQFSPTFGGGSTGGVRPSIFSDNTRALGKQLSADALTGQRTSGGNAVNLTPLPQAGVGDSILNNAATFTNLMGAIPYSKKKPMPPGWAGPDVPPTDWNA